MRCLSLNFVMPEQGNLLLFVEKGGIVPRGEYSVLWDLRVGLDFLYNLVNRPA